MIIQVQRFLIDLSLIYLIGEIESDNVEHHFFKIHPLNEQKPIIIVSKTHKKMLTPTLVDRFDESRNFDPTYIDSLEFNEIVGDLERIRNLIINDWLNTKSESKIKIIE